jgi:outer membrane protein OmpA-like peptidoglycan-associated protein
VKFLLVYFILATFFHAPDTGKAFDFPIQGKHTYKIHTQPFRFYVFDKKAMLPLDSAQIEVKDSARNLLFTLTTRANGEADTYLDNDVAYLLECRKESKVPDMFYMTRTDALRKKSWIHEDTIFIDPLFRSDCCGRIMPVMFQSNSYALTDTQSLRKILKFMLKYPGTVLEVEGNTDCRGCKAANLEMSKKRAVEVKNYLLNRGIKAEQVVVSYYGDKHPLNECDCHNGKKACDDTDYALNRRVDFKILKFK